MRPIRASTQRETRTVSEHSLILVALLSLLSVPATASDVFRTGVRSAEIGWDEPADAIVDGYFVWLSRNGGPEQVASYVAEPD